jgi:hypothetical protein
VTALFLGYTLKVIRTLALRLDARLRDPKKIEDDKIKKIAEAEEMALKIPGYAGLADFCLIDDDGDVVIDSRDTSKGMLHSVALISKLREYYDVEGIIPHMGIPKSAIGTAKVPDFHLVGFGLDDAMPVICHEALKISNKGPKTIKVPTWPSSTSRPTSRHPRVEPRRRST